jgi:LysR family carnitine catabolism transcriptional activator
VATRLVRDFDTAIHDLRATAERRAGHVSMAVLPSIANHLLPDIIKRFSTNYPGICIHLHDDNSQSVQQCVERNEVDFGLGSRWRPNAELIFTPILRDSFSLVCHKDHPLAQAKTPLTWTLDFPNIITLLAMLRSNIGVTALPALAIPRGDNELVSRELIDPVETRDICLISRRGATPSPAAEAMLETLSEQLPTLARALNLQELQACQIVDD